MKRNRGIIVFAAAVVVAAAFFYQMTKNETTTTLPENIPSPDEATHRQQQIKNTPLSVPDSSLLADIKGLNEEEKKSLLTLTSILAESMKPRQSYDQFTARLEKLKLAPKALIDQNQYTGKMTIVRTAMALPGTRYIHAQYFSDVNEKPGILQHISFELHGSADSMKAARRIVEHQFDLKVKPETDTPSFIAWHTSGKTIWIKKLTADDMKNDPYNSYDPKTDIGTVRIAVESEIH